jgi:hypothetical protein
MFLSVRYLIAEGVFHGETDIMISDLQTDLLS